MAEHRADAPLPGGPIAWMVHNRVSPNILMLVLLLGGLFFTSRVQQEVFPEFELDIATITVPYPGASPEEVERGIILAVEEAVRGLDGVEEVVSVASEALATINVEIMTSADDQKVFEEIRQAIDRITTFPDDAEEPVASLMSRRREVVLLQIHGDVAERVLREVAEQVRDRLLQDPGVTQVDLLGAREYEVHVEVDRETLRRYGLTLGEIARRIAATSVELPGGRIEARGGELLLRTSERSEWAAEFAAIPLVTTAGGGVLHLGDVARVDDDFEEVDRYATYDGKPSIGLAVYRIGDQTPMGVSAAVRAGMERIEPDLPAGIGYAIQADRSEIYQQRLDLLIRNALFGLVLVFGMLSLFLELRLAFWVTLGIPTAFLGSLLFLPLLGVSINMISLFAFIIALGIVVDDAIIAGENIYEYRQRGMGYLEASIRGARDVALPVGFSILTNIAAFFPLLLVPGVMGKIWGVIPLVVSTVFVLSWIEALFVLPSHLGHGREPGHRGWRGALHHRQQRFSAAFTRFIERYYGSLVDLSLRHRYATIAAGVAILVVVIAWAASGRLGFILMPKVESDEAVVTAVLPFGSSSRAVAAVRNQLVEAGQAVVDEGGGDDLAKGIFALVDENRIETVVYLTDPTIRPLSTIEFVERWRDRVGALPGLESIMFEADRGGAGRGPGITIELSHRDVAVLDRAGSSLAGALAEFGSTTDIDDGYTPGKPQIDLELRAAGRSLGLSTADVARQVRDFFYGAEALRQQRGRSEVKVLVHLPQEQRASEYDLEQLLVRTPGGRDVPLLEVAAVDRGRAYTTITRRDGRRTVTVTANVRPISETNRILATVEEQILPQLLRDHPGLTYSFEGSQAEMRDSVNSLIAGLGGALVVIYVLLAIPFRSYIQPAIVMMAIPFGIVGAVLGHQIMGYTLSVISLMGIVALCGVVVNDALVMIDYANGRREAGDDAYTAIRNSGVRRFRPIMLTTMTTFGGLAPMIFETSRQARFMIPMAISLGYGILFATAITLLLVPCLYMVVEDLRGLRPGTQVPSA
jgi:multidrug efflux pump subunit AcrB